MQHTISLNKQNFLNLFVRMDNNRPTERVMWRREELELCYIVFANEFTIDMECDEYAWLS